MGKGGQEVITGRIDIGPLWLRFPEALRGEVRIAPDSYARLTYNLQGGGSDNWDETAVALDLNNFILRQPTVHSIAEIARFLREKIADRRFMQKEFGSWTYLDLHATPTVAQYLFASKLAQSDPNTWAVVVSGLRSWLRALIGWLALTGCWGPGKTWTKGVARNGPGARLLTGTGDFSKRIGGTPYCVFTGKRSWVYDGDWHESLAAPVLLSDLGFDDQSKSGDVWKSHNNFMGTIEALYGALDLLTTAERSLVIAATRNDLAAIQWVIKELIGDWLPAESVTIVRTEHGVGQVMHEAAKSPTATMYYCGWDDDGTTYAAGACNGLRGGHAEQIEAGMAEIDLAARTGFCQRTSGPDRVRVDFPLPKGELVAVITAQHGAGIHADYYRNGQKIGAAPAPDVPPPATPSRPKRKKRPWWKFW